MRPSLMLFLTWWVCFHEDGVDGDCGGIFSGPGNDNNCDEASTHFCSSMSNEISDPEICTVICDGDKNVCDDINVIAGSGQLVDVTCSGTAAANSEDFCNDLEVSCFENNDVNIICSGGDSCRLISLSGQECKNVQIQCTGDSLCTTISIESVVDANVDIICSGSNTCGSITTTVDGGSVKILCDGDNSCAGLSVDSDGLQNTTLECTGTDSCIGASVTLSDTVSSGTVICDSDDSVESACLDATNALQISGNSAEIYYYCNSISCQTRLDIDASDSQLLEIHVSGDENAKLNGGTVTCPDNGKSDNDSYSCFFFSEYTGSGTDFDGHSIFFYAVEGLARDLFIECENYPDGADCLDDSTLFCTRTFSSSCQLSELDALNDTNGAECTVTNGEDCETYVLIPTSEPTEIPSLFPSEIPSNYPSNEPSNDPTFYPSNDPSSYPSLLPSDEPSLGPTNRPSGEPSSPPSGMPTRTFYPTGVPSDLQVSMATSEMPTPARDGDGSGADGSDGDLDSGMIILIVSASILALIIVLCLAYIFVRSRNNKSGGTGSKSDPTDTSKQPENKHKKSTKDELYLTAISKLGADQSEPPPPTDGPIRPVTGGTTRHSGESKTSATDANKAVAEQVNGKNGKEHDLMFTEEEEHDMKQEEYVTPGGPDNGPKKDDVNLSKEEKILQEADDNAKREIEMQGYEIKFPPIAKGQDFATRQEKALAEYEKSKQQNQNRGDNEFIDDAM